METSDSKRWRNLLNRRSEVAILCLYVFIASLAPPNDCYGQTIAATWDTIFDEDLRIISELDRVTQDDWSVAGESILSRLSALLNQRDLTLGEIDYFMNEFSIAGGRRLFLMYAIASHFFTIQPGNPSATDTFQRNASRFRISLIAKLSENEDFSSRFYRLFVRFNSPHFPNTSLGYFRADFDQKSKRFLEINFNLRETPEQHIEYSWYSFHLAIAAITFSRGDILSRLNVVEIPPREIQLVCRQLNTWLDCRSIKFFWKDKEHVVWRFSPARVLVFNIGRTIGQFLICEDSPAKKLRPWRLVRPKVFAETRNLNPTVDWQTDDDIPDGSTISFPIWRVKNGDGWRE